MITEPTADSSRTQPDEQTIEGSTNSAGSSSTQPDEETIGGSINTADSSSTLPDKQTIEGSSNTADNSSTQADKQTIGGSTNTADSSSTQPDEQTIGDSTNTADSSSTQPDEQTIGDSTNTADSSSTQPDEQTIGGSTNTADSSSTQPDEQTIEDSTNTADSSSTQPDEQTIGDSTNTADSSSTQPDEQTIGGSTNTADSSSTQPDEQTIGDSTNTVALLEACILNADHDALQEHLENNQTEQSVLDRCLMLGLQIVQRKEQEMGRVAPALRLLWQSGAKWNIDSLLEHQMTPYHVICLSAGDHHDLLDLLIQSSERTLLHRYTALIYAVKNANINCLKSLITHLAEGITDSDKSELILLAIEELQDDSKQSPIIMTEIFDFLLENGADVNKAMLYAITCKRFECIKKLIVKGADLDYDNGYVWQMTAEYGRVDLLKCLFGRDINKDITDRDGRSLLWYVTQSGKVDAIRYLLDLGVKVSTYVSKTSYDECKHCGVDLLVQAPEQNIPDPSIEAINIDNVDVVQLFEEYGSKSFEHFNIFRLAVIHDKVAVMEYLHKKYKHPLNINYSLSVLFPDCKHWTLLREACYRKSIRSVHYLLEHGADLNTVDRCSSALVIAIQFYQVELIALLICNGVDINFRTYDYRYGDVLPFEVAVRNDPRFFITGDIYTVELLLVAGCSCGVFNLKKDHRFKDEHIKDEYQNLMMKWNVHENNVKPLKQQCRRMILKHLSPRASKMIEKLPLPQCLIKYLSFPELDDIVDRYRRIRISYSIKTKIISGLRFFY